MATTLTWLNDVPAGGGTAYDAVAYEDVIQPTKGYQFQQPKYYLIAYVAIYI